jgi:hypothetical protein
MKKTEIKNVKPLLKQHIVSHSVLPAKHKKLISDILIEKIPQYETCIDSCQRFSKNKENDIKFWKKEQKKYENKKKLAVEILTEFGLF